MYIFEFYLYGRAIMLMYRELDENQTVDFRYIFPVIALILGLLGRFPLLLGVLCLKFYLEWVSDGLATIKDDN